MCVLSLKYKRCCTDSPSDFVAAERAVQKQSADWKQPFLVPALVWDHRGCLHQTEPPALLFAVIFPLSHPDPTWLHCCIDFLLFASRWSLQRYKYSRFIDWRWLTQAALCFHLWSWWKSSLHASCQRRHTWSIYSNTASKNRVLMCGSMFKACQALLKQQFSGMRLSGVTWGICWVESGTLRRKRLWLPVWHISRHLLLICGWLACSAAGEQTERQPIARQLLPRERGKGEPMLLRVIRPQINSSLWNKLAH